MPNVDVKIIRLEPMRVACAHVVGEDPEHDAWVIKHLFKGTALGVTLWIQHHHTRVRHNTDGHPNGVFLIPCIPNGLLIDKETAISKPNVCSSDLNCINRTITLNTISSSDCL